MSDLTNVKKLLIIRLSSLGDILLTSPLLRSIKANYPDINIDFVLKIQYGDALRYNPHIRNLFFYEDGGINFNENYDLVIDLQKNIRSKQITKKIKAPVVTFRKLDIEKFLLVRFKINKLKNAPPIPVRYAETIGNFSLDDKGPELFIPDEISSELPEGNYIAMAPGSRHFTKMWPMKYYIYLGKILVANKFNVVLLGGKDDSMVCEQIHKMVPGSINLCNEDNLLKTAAHMKKCRAVICNDSGLMHTACAAGTPVIAFYGSTVKEFGFSPYNSENLILENISLSCRPCSHIGRDHCPKKHFNCMNEITPHIAFSNLNRLLNTR